MIYLNHAGTSWPKPKPVREAVAQALEAPPETWSRRLEQERAAVCAAFGIEDPSRLLLTPGATAALSIAVSDHPWETGDRVLVSGFEHHALYRPVQLLAQRGIDVVVVPPGDGQPLAMDALKRELAKGGTRLVALTAACNVTGDHLPIDDAVRLAREHGALSLIDGAQIAGWIDLNLDDLGADLLVFTGHKGPQAPWGVGGLYVAPGVTMASPRAACELPASGEAAPCVPMPGFCDAGSVDRAALAGLVAGLEWLARPEHAGRLARARKQSARIAQAARALPGATLHGSAEPERRMPTVALTVAGRSPAELALDLERRSVIASGGQQCAPLAHETLGTYPEGVLRLSVGPATSDEDCDMAIDALTECLEGKRTGS